jgi:hypothetical protein
MSTNQLPEDFRIQLIKEEKLSKFALVGIYTSVYDLKNLTKINDTGIDLLDQEIKSTGTTNYHNLIYLKISKYYKDDAIYSIINYPKFYLKYVKQNSKRYFQSPDMIDPIPSCCNEIKILKEKTNIIYYGQFKNASKSIALIILFPLLLIYGVFFVYLFWDKDKSKSSVILFLMISIIYVFIISIFLSYGDQSRYRFMTDSFYFILFGMILQKIIDYIFYPPNIFKSLN